MEFKPISFLESEINYLEFVISEAEIKPDKKKLVAIIPSPIPTCNREVRSFIEYVHIIEN